MTPPLIMDLGLHNGDDTAFYLARGYRVVAVDADGAHIEAARRRFPGAILSGELMLEQCGLAAEDGEQTFYRSANTQWSSFEAGNAGRYGTLTLAITLPTRNPRFLFDKYGIPYYLKIDLEGNDRCVVDALAELGERPQYMSIELTDPSDVGAMAALGYTRFVVVDQSKLPRKGNPSGPFGAALDGQWVDADEASRQYAAQRAHPLSWFDLHATS